MRSWDLNAAEVAPRQPEVLHSEGEGRTILVALPAGEALDDHQVHERAWLVVVGGEVEIGADGDTVTGGPGLLAVFDPNERHEVRAVSDARVLLLLAPWPGQGHPRLRTA
ncbi:MAG TPA: cupin domain-containing protein [Solirubrobacteraceae bacterium]|nr:cupin domain-containing protein [Solirubrobacteraceae bacterium]